MPSSEPRVVLYERAGCHLCEETRVLMDEMLGQERYTRIDIEGDDALLVAYGHRIPVVAVDGVVRLEVPISAPELRTLADEVQRR